jgi:PAS domain S-box-containing protein
MRIDLRGTLPAWGVLGLALVGTALACWFAHVTTEREARQRFDAEMAAVQVDLVERLRTYEQVLRGGVGLFHSSRTVTRDSWRRYVEQLEIARHYPGIQGIGFARLLAPEDVAAHVAKVRTEGFGDYRIWPEGEREVYTTILFLEPFDWRNQRAFGYDMFQEPVRREAMERARETGAASISGKVTLVQETAAAVQAGFLMYLPVYRAPGPAGAQESRQQLVGYVYSPFRMHDFMAGLLGDRERRVALQIFDGDALTDDALLHTSGSWETSAASSAPFAATVPLSSGGRRWTLRFAALPGLLPKRNTPAGVAAGGFIISLLLWAITGSLARNRAQTVAAAARLQADVEVREQVAAQLREAEAGFRYLFEKNPNPMWVYDRETLEILEVNEAATLHYGWSREEFQRMTIANLRPPEDVPRLEAYVRRRPPGLQMSGEWRHLVKDGRIIDVELAGYGLDFRQRQAALVVARDITESKRAAQALKESEASARGVLDAALDAYVRMDQDGRITEWNLMAERVFGWTRDEAMEKPLTEILIPPEQREAHRQGLKRYLATGEGPMLNRRIEVHALRRDGGRLPVEITILAVTTESGKAFGAFLRDLTEKKRAEAQLLHAQKLEAVGRLTGGVAHDFNNLLTVIIGNLELAAPRAAHDPHLAEAIKDALAAGERGAALTYRLLAFSRQQALQPVRTDLNEIVVGMLSLLKRTLGEDIEIEARLGDKLWPELADKSQVENALLNLAINARDAMPEGGKLTIETRNTTLDTEYAAGQEEVMAGDYVMLAVSDTGTGMTPEIAQQAIDPFFTTKEVGKGSGLGLSMIFGFAKQSRGHLKIYSESGHGTTVKLYLPRAQAARQQAPPPELASAEEGGSETVLVVEDEEAVRKLVIANLKRLGYRTLEAADAVQAEAILKGDEPIDLLFTDVILPGGKTGRQLADEGRALRPAMRVLFTSGYTQNSITHQGTLDPGVKLLSKPYRREELARKVRQALR